MRQFEIPKLLKKDTYQVSNNNSNPSPWECKGGDPAGSPEGYPGSGDWTSTGNSWCS